MTSVGVLQGGLIPHEFELGLTRAAGSTAVRVPRSFAIPSTLGFDLLCPPLHHVFRSESNDEVLDAGVAFPENLASI